MLVSIILTCYKQEIFIEETILSVISQKYANWELLIGDDSPDDNCRKIISKYVKKYPNRIHAWHHNPNKGIVNNMLFLLEQRNKTSKYIAFLEGDDCMFPEYLDKKIEIFLKYPNIQLVYNELTTINSNSKILEEKIIKNCGGIFCRQGKISYKSLLNHTYYMSRSTLMIKSEILNKYPIYSDDLGSKTILSDVHFFNQVAHNEDIYGIDNPLTYYRIHTDSITKNVHGTIIFHLELIKYIEYLFKSGLIKNNTYRDQIVRCYLIIAIVTIKKCFTVGFYKTLNIFLKECKRSLKYRFNKIIK